MATIYVPGLGATTAESRAVDKAINEYDERLYLKENEETRQWCVYIKMGAFAQDIPVFGFDKIPTPEFAIESLYKADTKRHGEKILDDINKGNERAGQAHKDAVDNAQGEMVEGFEWGFRKMGAHPNPRIFVPGG